MICFMELPVEPSSQPSRGRNLERAPWCYLLWGVPAVLVVVASAAYGASILSLTGRGVVWVIAVAWAGVGCFLNGRSCGRVHCKIDGIVLPLFAIVGESCQNRKILTLFLREPVCTCAYGHHHHEFVPCQDSYPKPGLTGEGHLLQARP